METLAKNQWAPGGREKIVEQLAHDSLNLASDAVDWDLVIVGGGITGAGIFREATRRNLKVLLVERKDFAWGTSSKSSKMVHGGLRYLGSGQFGLTRDSVLERQRLMTEAPGLVDPLNFLMGHYKWKFPGPRIFNLLLTIYDWMAGKRNHRYFKGGAFSYLAPGLKDSELSGVTQFGDAVTDDARLVMRVLHEGVTEGGIALNYVSARQVERSESGQVNSITLKDEQSGKTLNVKCKAVINATGAWTDELRSQLGAETAIRPLRGSHLIFPMWRLPVSYSVSFFHPDDGRPVFVFPWEGVAVAGTTDLDHNLSDKQGEVAITQEEVEYLLKGVNAQFPAAKVSEHDAIGSYAGVRPVVGTGALNPSSEKREHSIWNEHGLISVAGGKLTTFRLIALDVLKEAAHYLPNFKVATDDAEIFKGKLKQATSTTQAGSETLSKFALRRLSGRYGSEVSVMLENATVDDLKTVRATDTLWAELDYALENESVLHLEDLMLRRTRLGLLLPKGGAELMPLIKERCQKLLGWGDVQWQKEVEAYLNAWRENYALPAQRKLLLDDTTGLISGNDTGASSESTDQLGAA